MSYYARLSALINMGFTNELVELCKLLPAGATLDRSLSKLNYIVVNDPRYGQVIITPCFSRLIDVQITGVDMEDYQEVFYEYEEINYKEN